MAQQVALRLHAERRGRHTFAAHPHSHLEVWEEQGYNAVHGLRMRRTGDLNELFTAADLAAIGEPLAAVVWELPQRDLGGLLPPWEELREQVALVRERGAAAHLDGARLFEAQTYYRRPFAEIAGLFDTVYVSLYKSLQGVRGAVLAADAATVDAARVWRQRLGGGIRDAWPLALAALAHLDGLPDRMAAYREHALALAAAINGGSAARACPDPPQTPCSTSICRPRNGPSSRPARPCSPSTASSCGGGCAPTPTPDGAASRSASARTPWTSPPGRWPT
ncbi:beta-eliminating lyase-related protein [Nonomuraea sp. NPDC049400]|uniref:threonine aldolase family protein n=1 Tax=Nonomuraea sp. NPDC049400 TaxID=3364352 RepID=UPI0037A61DB2